MKTVFTFFKCFLIHITLAIWVIGFNCADEFYQGPEVAYKDVYGYGYLTWEWTRSNPIRNPLYHSIISFIYLCLKYIGMDTPIILSWTTRTLQCILSSVFDLYLIKLGELDGIKSKYIYLALFGNWFCLSCFSMAYINTFETCLFIIALYCWRLYLDTQKQKYNLVCRSITIISFIARPTSIIPWSFIWPYHLLTQKSTLKGKIGILLINALTLVVFILLSVLADILYYKKITSSFYNFLEFNFLSGQSDEFGTSNITWFITNTIPFSMQGWMVFAILGVYQQLPKFNKYVHTRLYTKIIIYFTLIISISKHKEDRFILPIIPLLVLFTALGMQTLFEQKTNRYIVRITSIFLIFVLIHSGMAFIKENVIDKRDGFSLPRYLQQEGDLLTGVEMLADHHNIPFYSFVHKKIPFHFIDYCNRFSDKNENPILYENQFNKFEYIQQRMGIVTPSHIVIWKSWVNEEITSYFEGLNYEYIKSFPYKMNESEFILYRKRK